MVALSLAFINLGRDKLYSQTEVVQKIIHSVSQKPQFYYPIIL